MLSFSSARNSGRSVLIAVALMAFFAALRAYVEWRDLRRNRLGAAMGEPVLCVGYWRWTRIARSRGYWKPPRAAPKLLDIHDAVSALADGATLLAVRFTGHLGAKRTHVCVVVNNSRVRFPVNERRYSVVGELPVLLRADYPTGARRHAVLEAVPGAPNEITLKMNRFSPLGQRGIWIPKLTRLVPASELPRHVE